jgi:hypothetical protein
MLARAVRATGDQREDFLEHLPRYRDLGPLERDVAAVADNLHADLDQLLAHGGQRPRLRSPDRSAIAAPADPPQDAESHTKIALNTPKIAPSSGEGWPKLDRHAEAAPA